MLPYRIAKNSKVIQTLDIKLGLGGMSKILYHGMSNFISR